MAQDGGFMRIRRRTQKQTRMQATQKRGRTTTTQNSSWATTMCPRRFCGAPKTWWSLRVCVRGALRFQCCGWRQKPTKPGEGGYAVRVTVQVMMTMGGKAATVVYVNLLGLGLGVHSLARRHLQAQTVSSRSSKRSFAKNAGKSSWRVYTPPLNC